jgi:hypothetical protein
MRRSHCRAEASPPFVPRRLCGEKKSLKMLEGIICWKWARVCLKASFRWLLLAQGVLRVSDNTSVGKVTMKPGFDHQTLTLHRPP